MGITECLAGNIVEWPDGLRTANAVCQVCSAHALVYLGLYGFLWRLHHLTLIGRCPQSITPDNPSGVYAKRFFLDEDDREPAMLTGEDALRLVRLDTYPD